MFVVSFNDIKTPTKIIILNKPLPLHLTNEQAVRVYIWNKLGMTIPGLSKQDQSALTKIVSQNQRLVDFANLIGKISRMREGYVQPSESWLGGSIASDLNEAVDRVGRKIYLRQWIENKNEIFSEQNMNKIESFCTFATKSAYDDLKLCSFVLKIQKLLVA